MNPIFFFNREITPIRKLLMLHLAAGGKLIEDDAEGNPLTFLTDLARPLKELLVSWVPSQSGTGDPSPDNVRPISGMSGVNVNHKGKNLLYADKSNISICIGLTENNINNGVIYDESVGSGNSDYVKFKSVYKPGTYTISCKFTGEGLGNVRLLCSVPFTGGSYVSYYDAYYKDFVNNQVTFTTTESFSVGLCLYTGEYTKPCTIYDIQLEVGSTETAYTEYVPGASYPVTFPDEAGTVYGGTLDLVTGVLTVESVKASIKDFEWSYNDAYGYMQTFSIVDVVKRATSANIPLDGLVCDSYTNRSAAAAGSGAINNTVAVGLYGELRIRDDNYSDASTFVTAMGESVIVYPLATPPTYQLTPQQITALIGDNTIWSDANGNCEVTYLKKG